MAMDGEATMSDPQTPLPATASELVARILRWLVIAAVLLALFAFILPFGIAALPLGLILIAVVAVLFFAFGKMPPAWLACIDPKDVGKLGGAARPLLIALILFFVALLLGPMGLLVAAVVATVLFALGWAGIGPFAPFATIVRGLIQLIGLLPDLRQPLKLAAEALTAASSAVETLRHGLDDAQSEVGNVAGAIAAISVPSISVTAGHADVNVTAPNGTVIGSVSVPTINVDHPDGQPFAANVAPRLYEVQSKLRDARDGAMTQRDRLQAAGAALKTLHDLLPPGPGEQAP
jgi:hypothetical protein